MARALLKPDPENASIEELKQVSRIGSSETATRCTAIQMLLAGISRQLVRDALLVSNRALRKWINRFNQAGEDIWFADESGFEGDPRPRKRWDKKGRKTRVTKNGGHLRMNVIGMVCPRSGEFFAIEASHSDSATYQAFLDEANRQIAFQRTTNILIMDNASWHKRKSTNWHGWQPMYLPPYSPDLNPIERIWLTMKARWFNNHVCKNEEKLLERLDQAILDVIDNPDTIKQTTAIGTLF